VKASERKELVKKLRELRTQARAIKDDKERELKEGEIEALLAKLDQDDAPPKEKGEPAVRPLASESSIQNLSEKVASLEKKIDEDLARRSAGGGVRFRVRW
jgi:hypothetical protein